jgi:hypothetical protein
MAGFLVYWVISGDNVNGAPCAAPHSGPGPMDDLAMGQFNHFGFYTRR